MTTPRDQNKIPAIQGVLNSDGSTPTTIVADPSTHRLSLSGGSSGSDNGPTNAERDGNYVPTMMAVSEVDGTTPVVLYADSSGNLLVDSN